MVSATVGDYKEMRVCILIVVARSRGSQETEWSTQSFI